MFKSFFLKVLFILFSLTLTFCSENAEYELQDFRNKSFEEGIQLAIDGYPGCRL